MPRSWPVAVSVTSTVIVANDRSRVLVEYRYFMIPVGCESEACWVEATMASGSAEIVVGTRTTVVVANVINLPF